MSWKRNRKIVRARSPRSMMFDSVFKIGQKVVLQLYGCINKTYTLTTPGKTWKHG